MCRGSSGVSAVKAFAEDLGVDLTKVPMNVFVTDRCDDMAGTFQECC